MIKRPQLMLQKSFLNCHVRGLHSIVFDEEKDGRLTRMFIHEPGGDLSIGSSSVAAHCHRRDLKFTMLSGILQNLVVEQGDYEIPHAKVYDWQTPIGNPRGGHFTRLPGTVSPLIAEKSNAYVKGQTFSLRGYERHTVRCIGRGHTAWLIEEGDLNPNYDSTVWSFQDLENWNSEGLYQKFTSLKQIKDLIGLAGLRATLTDMGYI